MRRDAGERRPALRQHDHLAQLPARDRVTPLEGAVVVAADDMLAVGGFDVLVEGVVGLHVAEMWSTGGGERPAGGQGGDLWGLAARGRVVGAGGGGGGAAGRALAR